MTDSNRNNLNIKAPIKNKPNQFNLK